MHYIVLQACDQLAEFSQLEHLLNTKSFNFTKNALPASRWPWVVASLVCQQPGCEGPPLWPIASLPCLHPGVDIAMQSSC